MSVPVSQMWTISKYVMSQRIQGKKKYPLVLMLEPLFRCNLNCVGCGKIQYASDILRKELSIEDCLNAAKECGAPVVSIAGGEPLLHPQIEKILEGLVAQKKYIYLCTNAILLEEKLANLKPSKYLSLSIHLDGLEEQHDAIVGRKGIYQKAISAIKAALKAGFRVTTNTTFFNTADPQKAREFFDMAMGLGVEGMMISPGYNYTKASAQEKFLERKQTINLFRKILYNGNKNWVFNQSPMFLEFLAGVHDFECTPWGTVTYNILGWQSPCYLLEKGYKKSFKSLMEETPWEQYGRKSGNPECAECMMHCGYEPTAVQETFCTCKGFSSTVVATLGKIHIPPPEEM
ncbi:MAG: adenosyl-hopene transferase HpnH [Candidatus Brocadiae bacterium]|nr:adenosyl-hopene transferase HpnH [Candidatus Brocadiia bacterium]